MKDLFLRAGSEQLLIDALPFARLMDDEGTEEWIYGGCDFVLDIIGVLHDSSHGADFHANIRLLNEDIEASIPPEIIIPAPNNPRRRWA